MAPRSNEYTHGGSAGKNVGLLLRALLNLIAFGAFWLGLLGMTTDAVTVPAPPLALALTLGGGALSVNVGELLTLLGSQSLHIGLHLLGLSQGGVGLSLTLLQDLVDGLPKQEADSHNEDEHVDDGEEHIDVDS